MRRYLLFLSIISIGLLTLAGCAIQKPANQSINNISNTTSQTDFDAIKQALATKAKWPADQTTITVLQNTGDHARGGVMYQDENGSGGGYWFAVKEVAGWRIVLDGNGTIPCTQMRLEGFIEAMIPDCCEACQPYK